MNHLRKFRYLFILAATWGLFFTVLFSRSLTERPNGLWANHQYVWADWSLHIGMASIFAEKAPSEWFAYHPAYANGQFTYPFLTNFISGMLMRVGFSLPAAFVYPSIALALLLLLGMFACYWLALGSQRKALLAITLFFMSAGLGFLDFFKDFYERPALLSFFIPPKDYGRMDAFQWYASNWVTGLLLPQRAMLIGMMLATWSMAGLLAVLLEKVRSEDQAKKILVVSGIAAGILPIAHMHSLMVLVLLLPGVLIYSYRRWKLLLYYVVPAGVLATTLYLIFVAGKIESKQFMSWHPGYTAQDFGGWVYFWFHSFGLMIPSALAGAFFIRGKHRRELQFFFGGFLLLWVAGNLIYFQPQPWDNSKMFLWAYFGFAGLAAHLLYHLWRRSRKLRPVAAVLFFFLVGTGWLQLVLVQRYEKNQTQVLSREELDLADLLRQKTGSQDRFLTGTNSNQLVMMRAARPILLGYTAWVWNFGFDYAQVERDVPIMYRGGPAVPELLKKYQIRYVMIGPWERHDQKADSKWFLKNYPVAFRTDHILVFDAHGSPPAPDAIPYDIADVPPPVTTPVASEAEVQMGDNEFTPSGPFKLGGLRFTKFNAGWGTFHRNQSIEGNRLNIGGVPYDQGLGTHVKSEVNAEVPEGSKRLTGKCGIDAETGGNGSVQFKIEGDGKLLFDSGVLKGKEVKEFNVSVEGVKALKFLAEDGGDGMNSDHADWVDIKVQ